MNNHRIPYIDVWRFFAIALVIVSHVVEFSHPVYREMMPGLVWRIHPLGKLGVEIFFCISGFVICRGMMRETVQRGSVGMAPFYLRRAFRILPPLFLYGAFLAAMSRAGLFEVTPAQLAQSALFACNIDAVGECGWFLGHTWSLAYEEQFYLLFPLLFAALALTRHRLRLVMVALGLAAAAISMRINGHPELAFYLSTFTYMVWGCACALYYDPLESLLQRLPVPAWLALAVALVALNLIALPQVLADVVYPAVAPLAICVLVLGTPLRHARVRALFGNPRLGYLGQISYTVYLWQQAALKDYGLASPLPAFVLIGLVFWLAHLSFRYLEMPLIRIGAAWSARLGAAYAQAPASISATASSAGLPNR